MSSPGTLEERLGELEAQIAHQDKTLQDLSDVIAEQSKSIGCLLSAMEVFKDRLFSMEETAKESNKPADDKPPHY